VSVWVERLGGEGAIRSACAAESPMNSFITRRPIWSLIIFVLVIAAIWLVFAPWPQGFEAVFGKKKLFLNAVINGITLGGLYFLVASGFTLIFGLMRNVNLAHGSIYLLGGYFGYLTVDATGSWLFSFVVAFVVAALLGVILQVAVFRRMEGQDLRQTLVTIGISIVLADLMLWGFGGNSWQIQTPAWLRGPMDLPLVTAVKSSGEVVYLSYPIVRLVIFFASVVIGLAMWLVLNRTRIGMIVRAGVDDREMLSAMGVPIQLVFVDRLRVWRRARRDGRRGRRNVSIAVAGRRHAVSARLADRGHRRRHGFDPGRGAWRGHHRARRADRTGLFPDLCDRSDFSDHGARAGRPAAGPAGGPLSHGACREPHERGAEHSLAARLAAERQSGRDPRRLSSSSCRRSPAASCSPRSSAGRTCSARSR
jgi:branched-chain amino acid transport system permease protein